MSIKRIDELKICHIVLTKNGFYHKIYIGGIIMKSYIKFFDNLSLIGKLVFCIPVLNICWAIYRICKGIDKSNILLLIVGILWIVPGGAFLWLVDLITIILFGKPILS